MRYDVAVNLHAACLRSVCVLIRLLDAMDFQQSNLRVHTSIEYMPIYYEVESYPTATYA